MPERPNILLIMTDQQRADLRAGEGYPLDTMPTLDRLAGEGIAFERAYTPCPICAPARCSLFTGRYPSAHRVRMNYDEAVIVYHRDLLDVLADAGYRRWLVGKNHSHLRPPRFDSFSPYGHTRGPHRPGQPDDPAYDDYLAGLVHRIAIQPTPFPVETQYPVRIVDQSIALLDNSSREPFFLWVSFPEPHNPYQAPEPYFSLFPPDDLPDRAAGPEAIDAKNDQWRYQLELIRHYHGTDCDDLWRRYRSNYLGMLRLIDDQVGRLVVHLDSTGRLDDTIVCFVSDHGDYVAEYGLWRKGVGLPECLTRVPFVWRGPGIAPRPDARLAHVSLVDLFPTLCEALGAAIPDGVQGRSLWPLLTGSDAPAEEFGSAYAEHGLGIRPAARDEVPFDEVTCYVDHGGAPRSFHELNNHASSGLRRMVRAGDWKLVVDLHYGEELYHLATDPFELNNRAEDPACREVRELLIRELLRWTIRLQDPLPITAEGPQGWIHSARRVFRGEHNWDIGG